MQLVDSGYVMVGGVNVRSVGTQTGQRITTLALRPPPLLDRNWRQPALTESFSSPSEQRLDLTVSEVALSALFFIYMPDNLDPMSSRPLVVDRLEEMKQKEQVEGVEQELNHRIEQLERLLEKTEQKIQYNKIVTVASCALCCCVWIGSTNSGASVLLPLVAVGSAVYMGRQQEEGSVLRVFSDRVTQQTVEFLAQ